MPVPLRTDFNAAALRTIARQTKDGPQARRVLGLAAIYEGATRTEAARIGGVTVQIVRDWVVKFNAHGPEAWSTASHLVSHPSSPMRIARPWWPGSMRARSPRSTAWCAGG